MNKRYLEIDITKGLLVTGMIFNHVYTILGNGQNRVFQHIDSIINLVTFSGFFFCFGFAMWVAYLQKPLLAWNKIIKATIKYYIAFVISGVASRIFLSSERISLDLIYNVAMIRDTPPYSEFLLSFVVITIFGAIFKRGIYLLTQRWEFLFVFTIISFVFTFFLQGLHEMDPLIGVFIGSKQFYVFPIVQYLPLFLIGVFVARNPQWFQLRIYVFLTIGIIILLISALIKDPITRFPPSVIWILLSIDFVFLYRGFGQTILEKFPNSIKYYQITIGQNVLLYLLISNLIIFIGNLYKPVFGLDSTQTVIVYILIMGFIFLIQSVSTTNHQVIDKTG